MLFYNYIFFVALCLSLAVKFSKNQSVVMTSIVLLALTTMLVAYYSVCFFLGGS